MSDGGKRILSPFTGCKKQKASNKTREKYMPVKRRHSFAESCYKEERLEELGSKGEFYNVSESDNHYEGCNENNKQQQLPDGFVNSCYKIVSPILLQKLIKVTLMKICKSPYMF